jgi:hypothetical protein
MADILMSVPWHCEDNDCPVGWHLANYWSSDEPGESYTVDSYADGDHESVDEIPTHEESKAAWKEYADDCYATGNDPLGEYMVSRERRAERKWEVIFTPAIVGLVCRVRRAGRGPWVSDLSGAPPEVRDYLSVEKRGGRWVFADEESKGEASMVTIERLRGIVEGDKDLRVRWSARGLKVVFKVTEACRVSESVYRRELRKLIKRRERAKHS